jgi:HamA
MGLFRTWCDSAEEAEEEDARKRYWLLSEKKGGRDAIRTLLAKTMRSHYDRLERIAEDVTRLGYERAALILSAAIPKKPKARSGDLGEILATELVEEKINLNVPVRRLRYKDGREMAMRGDDFIGAGYGSDDKLWLLKGEAKSNKVLGKTTVTNARKVLNRDHGRCTPDSLLFVANRLLESADEKEVALGRAIRDEVGCNSLRPDRIDHMLFTMSGNNPPAALRDDFEAAGTERAQYVINLRIEDHQEFIAEMYERALNLGKY